MASTGYTLSVDIIGADTLEAAFRDATGICQKALADGLNKTANEVLAEAKNLAPHDTGTLWRSLHVEPAVPAGTNLKALVGTDLQYAIYQEYGTGIYSEFPGASKQRIMPKGKKALYWPGAAHPVRSVAGVRPKFYMKQARDHAKEKMVKHMDEALGIIVEQLAK